jgi:hypothetical protein
MAIELTLEQLKDLARSHWKKHLPKLNRNLKKSGELEKRVENAAKFTLDAFSLEKERLVKNGLNPNQASEVAWELVREEWILLRSEEHERVFGHHESEPNEEMLELLRSKNPPRRIRMPETSE